MLMDFRLFFTLSEAQDVIAEADAVTPYKGTQTVLDPITGKNWRYADRWRQVERIALEEIRKNGTDPNRIWVTFSKVPKLGIWPSAGDGSTPFGIYGYPYKYVVEKEGKVEYAGHRPYIIVFKVKGKILPAQQKNNEKFKAALDQARESLKGTDFSSIFLPVVDEIKDLIDDSDYKKNKDEDVDLLNDMKNYFETLAFSRSIKEVSKEGMIQFVADKAKNDLNNILTSELVFDDTIPKYKVNIKDSTFRFTDEFLKYSPQNQQYRDVDFPIKSLAKFSSRSSVYQVIDLVKKLNALPNLASSPYDKYFDEANLLLKKFKEKNKNTKIPNLPYMKEVKALADKNGLDFDKAFREAMNSLYNFSMDKGDNENLNPMNLVYRVVGKLAEQTKGTSYVQWNKMMRDIGLPNVTDFGTNSIYSGEPTQGAFMDPTKIESIGLVLNRSNVGQIDLTGRPREKDWKNGSHEVPPDPSSTDYGGQRASSVVLREPQYTGMTTPERTTKALELRINQLTNGLQDITAPTDRDRLMNMYSVIAKVLYSYKSLMPSKYADQWFYLDRLNNELDDLESRVGNDPQSRWIIKKIRSQVAEIKQIPSSAAI